MAARKRVVWSHPIRTDSLELGFIRLVRPVIFYFYGLTPRRQRLLLATGLFWREKDGALGFGIKPGFVFDGASVPQWAKSLAPDKLRTMAAALLHDALVRFLPRRLRPLADHLFRWVLSTRGRGSDATRAAPRMWLAVRLYTAWRRLVG